MKSGARQVTDLNGARHILTRQIGRGGQGAVFEVQGGRLAAKIVFDSSASRREKLRNQLTQVKRLSLTDLEIARPLEMLREPVLGYLMELLTGMQPLSALCNPPKSLPSVKAWYFETGGLELKLTRFRGASMLSNEGAHDAKKQTAVPAGIPRADRRTGQDGPHAQRAVA